MLREVPSTPLNHALSISTPMGNIVVISYEFKNYPLSVGDNIRSANLLPLEMSDFDIILGMDWLTKNRATIDCHLKRVIFGYLNNLEFIYHGSRPELFFVYNDPIFESQEISTSNAHQQSLADAGSETRPPMLKRGSYIPWVSRFRRYLNRKRENRKWLNKAIDEGPYEFRIFFPSETEAPRMQKEDDLRGDDLKHYEAKIEAMNLILISIPNDIYNSVDACKTAKAMWQRVKRLMRGTVQNKVDRETRFNNEFDQFVVEPGEALVLIDDSYDDLFDYLHQFKKLVNASRAKKLEKSHDPLALVAHTGSSSRTTTTYYVTHPSLVVDYDDDYQGDAIQNNFEDPLTPLMILLARAITQHLSNLTNNRLRTSSNTKNQAIVQGDRVNIESKNSGNNGKNIRRSYVQEEIIEGNNVQNDAGNIQITL
ncbi:retrovirus-related pol polyprotein from transposon TNT 1-94 [Tanacetum coccineum]